MPPGAARSVHIAKRFVLRLRGDGDGVRDVSLPLDVDFSIARLLNVAAAVVMVAIQLVVAMAVVAAAAAAGMAGDARDGRLALGAVVLVLLLLLLLLLFLLLFLILTDGNHLDEFRLGRGPAHGRQEEGRRGHGRGRESGRRRRRKLDEGGRRARHGDDLDGRRRGGFGDVAGDVGAGGDDVGVGAAEIEALLDVVATWRRGVSSYYWL